MTTVTETYAFDALGRTLTAADGLGNTSTYLYDARHQVRVAMDPEGNATSHTYDGLNRRTKTVRPEGISEEFIYDASSRLLGYKDALANTTSWGYDTLNRRTSMTYPDSVSASYGYDDNDNLISTTDPNGTVVANTYDPANRLTARAVTPATGVVGPMAETYSWDGLNRLTQGQSGTGPGAIARDLTYDSLSRMLSETTLGRPVQYTYDEVSNRTATGYPSGKVIGRNFDPLNRPLEIGELTGSPSAPTLTPEVTYGYRGRQLRQTKTLANGVSGAMTFDGARRPLTSTYLDPLGNPVLAESHSWSPRSLRTATERLDLGGAGQIFHHDGAGQLGEVLERRGATSLVTNNQPSPAAGSSTSDHSFRFTYDKAQNLTKRSQANVVELSPLELPNDTSGRNRPSSLNGTPLEWDANGNMTRRGNLRLNFDFRNRLTQVTDLSGTEIASYEYDTSNRRVRKTLAGSSVFETVWSDWQAVEEYFNGQLLHRRTFGGGLDEQIRMEADLDQNGTLETDYVPLYDQSGHISRLTGPAGQLVGMYRYSPLGGDMVAQVDATPAEVEQALWRGGQLWLEFSEEVLPSPLLEAVQSGTLHLVEPSSSTEFALTAELPLSEGRQAHHRLVLTPVSEPPVGTILELIVPAGAMRDLFTNMPSSDYTLPLTWPAVGAADMVLSDTVDPEVELVYVKDSHLKIEFSEEVNPTLASTAIQLNNSSVSWLLEADGYTLSTTTPLAPDSYTLDIGTQPLDLSNKGLAASFDSDFILVLPVENQAIYQAPNPTEVPLIALNNLFGFKGRPLDEETGLVYFRNRYYDPEMGRFISADPMGFVDGPSMYAFAGYDPVNMGDPLGLEIMVTGTYQDKYLEYLQRLLPFQIKLDKGKVVLDGVAGKKKLKKLRKSLDKKELELFKAIVQRIKITIATTGRDSGINFGRFDGKGKNSLDFSDLKLLEESNNAGGPFTPERVVGHETLEAFASAKDHKRPPSPKNTAAHEVYMRELLYRSHIDANQYFGGLGDVIPKSEKKTYTEDKSKIVTISLEIPIHGSSGHSIRVTHKFITPTPVVPEGDEKSPAHIVDVERIPR